MYLKSKMDWFYEEAALAGCNISLTPLCSFTMYNTNYTYESTPPTERVQAFFIRPSAQKSYSCAQQDLSTMQHLCNMNSAEERFSILPTSSCLPSWNRVFLSASTQLIMASSSIILRRSFQFRIRIGIP